MDKSPNHDYEMESADQEVYKQLLTSKIPKEELLSEQNLYEARIGQI